MSYLYANYSLDYEISILPVLFEAVYQKNTYLVDCLLFCTFIAILHRCEEKLDINRYAWLLTILHVEFDEYYSDWLEQEKKQSRSEYHANEELMACCSDPVLVSGILSKFGDYMSSGYKLVAYYDEIAETMRKMRRDITSRKR